MSNSVPLWLLVMRKYDGMHELLPDGTLNPEVRKAFEYTLFPKDRIDAKTAWCAAQACRCLEVSGVKSPFSAAAIDFEDFGDECSPATPGAILIFRRNDARNPRARHVGFSEGLTDDGRVLCRAGNQHNKCCVVPRDLADLVTARWPNEG